MIISPTSGFAKINCSGGVSSLKNVEVKGHVGPLGQRAIMRYRYSGKLSREKTFTNFTDLMPFVKVFSTKMRVAHFGLQKQSIETASNGTIHTLK